MNTRNRNGVRRIFVDMDGVITQFSEGVLELFGLHPGKADEIKDWGQVHDVIGVTEEQMWDRINGAGPGWWANLRPYPWMDSLFRKIEETAPFTILTTPSRDSSSAAGKVEWLKKHLGSDFRDYVLAPRKYNLAGPLGHVLIDDRDHNCDLWVEGGGSAIVFPMGYNTRRDATAIRVEYIGWELDMISRLIGGSRE